LQGQLKWLACNEKSCVPGKAELKLELRQAAAQARPVVSPESAAIARATAASAELRRDIAWHWREHEGKIVIEIPSASEQAWQDAELFPATENWLSPLQTLRLQRDDRGWRAVVERSEYFTQKPGAVELWIVPAQGRAVRLLK
jgi:DsbC/DsbD-like thiol-disulfide interchange protein